MEFIIPIFHGITLFFVCFSFGPHWRCSGLIPDSVLIYTLDGSGGPYGVLANEAGYK